MYLISERCWQVLRKKALIKYSSYVTGHLTEHTDWLNIISLAKFIYTGTGNLRAYLYSCITLCNNSPGGKQINTMVSSK